MKTVYFSIILVCSMLLFSCSNEKRAKQISKIDSLYKVLDTVDIKLKQINIDSVKNRYRLYKVTNDTVSKHFPEVRTDESWKYICAFQNVRKPFKNMSLSYDFFRAELQLSKKQLEDLKHDVEKKLLKGKDFDKFFTDEYRSVNDLQAKIMNNVNQVNAQMKNFDTVQPYLMNLIREHKSKKKH